jgi:hypothetical protein
LREFFYGNGEEWSTWSKKFQAKEMCYGQGKTLATENILKAEIVFKQTKKKELLVVTDAELTI